MNAIGLPGGRPREFNRPARSSGSAVSPRKTVALFRVTMKEARTSYGGL